MPTMSDVTPSWWVTIPPWRGHGGGSGVQQEQYVLLCSPEGENIFFKRVWLPFNECLDPAVVFAGAMGDYQCGRGSTSGKCGFSTSYTFL